MKNFLLAKLSIVSLIFLLSQEAFSQKEVTQFNDSINRISRKYKREIAIDCQGLLLRNPSASVILKTKAEGGQFVSVSSYKNNRYQVTLNGTLTVSEETKSIDPNYNAVWKDPSNFRIGAMYGREKVVLYGRFNFYYGFDLGPYYQYSQSGYLITYNASSSSGTYSWLPSESKQTGFAIVPFMGCKYRFSERFSVSLESGLSAAYSVTQSKSIYRYTMQNQAAISKKSTGIYLNFQYIRFLTLNYHL